MFVALCAICGGLVNVFTQLTFFAWPPLHWTKFSTLGLASDCLLVFIVFSTSAFLIEPPYGDGCLINKQTFTNYNLVCLIRKTEKIYLYIELSGSRLLHFTYLTSAHFYRFVVRHNLETCLQSNDFEMLYRKHYRKQYRLVYRVLCGEVRQNRDACAMGFQQFLYSRRNTILILAY